ncbi:Maf-like protein-domain-containing protein [Delphinella strobiligena]|nr:Maf-like protein-domain-containing protein [Delphinella strobiligena]
MSYANVPSEPPPSYESAAEHTIGGPKTAAGPRATLPLELPALVRLKGERVILASASPQRKQLLAQIGLTNIEIIPSTVPEDFSKTLAPFEYVLQTAEQKCMNVYRAEIDSPKGEPALVIAADTVVVSAQGEILEKPRNEKEHVSVLRALRNAGWHKVYTAVVCMSPLENAADPGYAIKTHCEETVVKFAPEVSDELIVAYVNTREGADKAGGYGIQGMGAILVERVEGDYGNVVGLPLRATLKCIEQVLRQEPGSDEDEEDE